MSIIDMCAHHSMTRDDAQSAADDLACDLAQKFQINYHWSGDHINFKRPGVHGQITVREGELRIRAQLGLMLMFLKPQIENEIVQYLTSHFGVTFD